MVSYAPDRVLINLDILLNMSAEANPNKPDPIDQSTGQIPFKMVELSYISEIVTNLCTSASELSKSTEGILEKLKSLKGLVAIFLILFGIFLLTMGVRFKKISLGTLFLYVIYGTLKLQRDYVDTIAVPINDWILKIPYLKNLDIYGDPHRYIPAYIFLSIVILAILSVFVFWLRIAGVGVLIFIVYSFYKQNFKEETDEIVPLDYGIILGITVILIVIGLWLEDLILGLIICFLGSALVLGFTQGYFEFPKDFDKFFSNLLTNKKIYEAVQDINFIYIILPTIACTLIQRYLYSK